MTAQSYHSNCAKKTTVIKAFLYLWKSCDVFLNESIQFLVWSLVLKVHRFTAQGIKSVYCKKKTAKNILQSTLVILSFFYVTSVTLYQLTTDQNLADCA